MVFAAGGRVVFAAGGRVVFAAGGRVVFAAGGRVVFAAGGRVVFAAGGRIVVAFHPDRGMERLWEHERDLSKVVPVLRDGRLGLVEDSCGTVVELSALDVPSVRASAQVLPEE